MYFEYSCREEMGQDLSFKGNAFEVVLTDGCGIRVPVTVVRDDSKKAKKVVEALNRALELSA